MSQVHSLLLPVYPEVGLFLPNLLLPHHEVLPSHTQAQKHPSQLTWVQISESLSPSKPFLRKLFLRHSVTSESGSCICKHQKLHLRGVLSHGFIMFQRFFFLPLTSKYPQRRGHTMTAVSLPSSLKVPQIPWGNRHSASGHPLVFLVMKCLWGLSCDNVLTWFHPRGDSPDHGHLE